MFKEFKIFIMHGNVMDLAIGIVIGAAFGTIISSFVNDILMPPIGLLLGKVDFANLFITLSGPSFKTLAESKAGGAVTLNYGQFINTIINFLIIAFSIFIVVKQINKFKKSEPAEAPVTKECDYCKTAIPLNAVRCPNCTSELKA